MKVFFLIFLLLFGYKSQSQSKTFIFKGKLVMPIKTEQHCGVLSLAELLVFSVPFNANAKVESKRRDTVGIYLLCPADYAKNFVQVGKMYKISYTRDTSEMRDIIKTYPSGIKYHCILGVVKEITPL